MNTKRKQVLKELGLTPLWRIKSDYLANHAVTQTHSYIKNQHKKPPSAIKTDEARYADILKMDWDKLINSVTNCKACPLNQTRTQTVFGIGDQHANWMYIGEGPGAREDATGEPFVGQAGKLLDNMLTAIGLKRDDQVYITNIVKCRPPNNRNPALDEARQCEPYLARQIALVKPKLIVALGKVAAQNLLKRDESISNLRGRLHEFSGIPLVVTYHPAYLLRTLSAKSKVWEDLCFARATMQSLT